MSNVERTGTRDLMFSKLHRLFGEEILATDIDFLEISNGSYKPLALIETKIGLMNEPKRWQRNAITNLAAPRATEIPSFVINRNSECTEFMLYGLNKTAKNIMNRIFKKPEIKDYYYKMADGTIRMNVMILQKFFQILHGKKTVSRSKDKIDELSKFVAKINGFTDETVDINIDELLK